MEIFLDVYKRQGVDSYNVSVAAGILCYDVLRRRTAKK